MNLEQYTEAKKLFETFDLRSADNSLSVEQAWTNKVAADVRAERNKLIAKCDWTQLADSQLSDLVKAGWTTYRQELRDLPTAEGFPHTMTWPTEPS